MPGFRYLLYLFVLLTAAGCGTTTKDIKVDTESRLGSSLSGYKTYAWLLSAEIVNDPKGQWEPPNFDADAELRHLINRELRELGLLEVELQPDILVGFAAGIDMQALKMEEADDTATQSLQNVPQGTLAVVLIDTNTRRPVWLGKATGDLQQPPDTKTVRKRLDYAITRMFEELKQPSAPRSGYRYGY